MSTRKGRCRTDWSQTPSEARKVFGTSVYNKIDHKVAAEACKTKLRPARRDRDRGLTDDWSCEWLMPNDFETLQRAQRNLWDVVTDNFR